LASCILLYLCDTSIFKHHLEKDERLASKAKCVERKRDMKSVKLIPRRTTYALNTTLSSSSWALSWDRVYRQVFWLSDGERDVARIAQLLHKPENLITTIMDELAVTGFISLHTNKQALAMNA